MTTELKAALETIDWELRQQQQEIERIANEQSINPYRMQDRNGSFVLAQVLVARANALAALAAMS